MKRIKKYQGGSYFRLPSLSSEFQTGASYVANVPPYINTQLQQYITNTGIFSAPIPTSNKVKDNTLKDTVSNIGSSIIGKASDAVSDKIFGDSELGRNLGTIFSSGLNSVGDTVLNNAIKKAALTDGLTKNLGSSVGGAVAGLGANYLGRGITSILGNNAASRFLGQSASTVGGTIGGKILSSGTKNLFSGPGSINPIGLGMSAVGAGLSAATGPSKEYNGTYGSTTKALDTVYDALQAGINFVPGWGQIASGAMALNKGLSNIFGSTDGMTSTDAILGSAFMPAPIKWLNMLGSSKTGTFNKQSWQNTQKTSNFMQNAFGDLEDKFSKAREEAGKIYGTFSQGAKRRAQDNIDFSNFAWNKILNMADQNEYQNIRSSDMASINNQKYAQWIQGGFSPLARGKKGMKIFNNSINHNLGQRLLSGAALIDSKQMILSAQNGTKIKKKGIKSGINVDYYDPGNVMSVVANNPDKTIVLDEQTIKPNARQRLGYYMKNAPAADIDKVMLGTLALGSAPIAAQAAIPSVSTLGDYIAGTKLVNVGNKVITNPYVSSAIESAFAGHGLNHAINEGVDGWGDAAMTALEMVPLGGLARPMWNTAKNNAKAFYNNLTMDLASTPGTYYVGYPKRGLSTLMPGKTGGIFLTPDKKFARGYTGAFGTGKVYETKVNFGENPVHINAKGRYFDEIAEQDLLDAFDTTVEEMKELGLKPFYTKKGLFSKKPPQRYYHIDDISTFGKKKGASSLIVDNVSDQGPGIFGFGTKGAGQQVIVYSPEQVSLLKPAPQITAENTSNYPSIMADADDFSYKGLSSIKSDMEKIIYNNKIHGKPMYPSDEGITGFSKNVQTGVPKTEYNELLHDVIGRNVREFKRAGLNDAQVSDYINNAKNAMDNVHIGMYSNSDYIKGGWGGFGGFYDSEGNFISVNTGSPLSKTKVVKHEGRHLLDHKVDDEILMPTSESFGNDFDSDVVLSTMQKVKQNQNMILYDAYDNDFITLPNKKGFNDGLEGYSNMGREAITTNLDSRNTLLGSKAGWDFDTTDKIIDKMPDAAIFEAVEKANGYGKRFIKFLRENNKLTPKKAQQFREAMKHVGAYAAPVGVAIGTSAATLYNKSK